jgi:hypothetical protein
MSVSLLHPHLGFSRSGSPSRVVSGTPPADLVLAFMYSAVNIIIVLFEHLIYLHFQRDGVVEADAARIDDMIEQIRRAGD